MKPKVRKYHLAKLFANDGGVSALCFKKPRRINLNRETWTIRQEAVTCKHCLKLLSRGVLNPWRKKELKRD